MTALSETAWTGRVIDIARLHGWRVGHFRPAQTAKGWRTPMSGHVGVPDLLLARGGDVLMAELKSDSGRLRTEQVEWLAALGAHGCVWRPRDAHTVLARLARQVSA